MPQDSLLLMTGGTGGDSARRLSWIQSFTSSTQIYPNTSNYSPPPLPSAMYGPTTFVTSEPSALVATCGGYTGVDHTSSCLVLDQVNRRWDRSRMGNLTLQRTLGAVATLNYVGVFILGGEVDYPSGSREFSLALPLKPGSNKRTSEFLPAGKMEWEEGPDLPVDMREPCAVSISPTSFLAIYGNIIREFDVAIAGPTSSEGWRHAERWPLLKQGPRTSQPGCAKIGEKVVIAGGSYNPPLSSTDVLDLVDRRISSGGEMAKPRRDFHIGTIILHGQEKMFALAGLYGDNSKHLTTVEEWVEASSSWKAADSSIEKRAYFGATVVPRQLICPT